MQCIFWPNSFKPSDSVISFVCLLSPQDCTNTHHTLDKVQKHFADDIDTQSHYLRKIFRHIEVHLELVLVVGDLRLGGHLRVCHVAAVFSLVVVFTAEITARDCPVSSLSLRPVSVSVGRAAWLPGCLAPAWAAGVGGWCHFMTSRTLFYSVPGLNKQKGHQETFLEDILRSRSASLIGISMFSLDTWEPDSAAWLGPASLESTHTGLERVTGAY